MALHAAGALRALTDGHADEFEWLPSALRQMNELDNAITRVRVALPWKNPTLLKVASDIELSWMLSGTPRAMQHLHVRT